MDIKEYISSGILENYVLNNLSEQERQEVECMSHIYPEIKLELTKFQESIEKLAEQYAKTPPAELKNKILDIIDKTEQLPKEGRKEVVEDTSKVVSINRNNTYRFAAAASILIAVGSIFMFINNSSKLKKLEKSTASTISELQSENKALASTLTDVKNNAAQKEILVSHLKDTSTKQIILAGSDKYPEALATIFWNSKTKETYIELNNLNTPSKELQYQLWAIVDGKPLDMGVFDLDSSNEFQKVIAVNNPQAFAVTLETAGGNPTPNLEQLVVIGNVGG